MICKLSTDVVCAVLIPVRPNEKGDKTSQRPLSSRGIVHMLTLQLRWLEAGDAGRKSKGDGVNNDSDPNVSK
jgi:hypothetical protein